LRHAHDEDRATFPLAEPGRLPFHGLRLFLPQCIDPAMNPDISLRAATPHDQPAIEALLDAAFGLSRRTKTSYRLREGSAPAPGLSLVAVEPELGLVGTISYWPLRIGRDGAEALLLGPIAIHPSRQNKGIGLALMKATLATAREQGHALVVLVGDAPYYARVGFMKVPEGQLLLPGPVDPNRLLFLELRAGALSAAHGLVLPAWRFDGNPSYR
jgi:predicted N-acetyltransferase YhbS